MKAPFGPLFPTLAVAAIALAVWAGPDYVAAIPLTTLAVAAAGATIFDAVQRRGGLSPLPPVPRDDRVVGIRDLIRAGVPARPEILAVLDRIDRAGDHPDLPRRTQNELLLFVGMTHEEFLGYVRTRLDALEGSG